MPAKFSYQHLFEKAPFGLAVCTLSGGELIAVNQAFADIIGRTIDDAKLSYWNITPSEYAEQEAEQLHRLETQGRYGPYFKEFIHKEGHTVPVQLWGGVITMGRKKCIWSVVNEIENPFQVSMFVDAPYGLALTCYDPYPGYEQGALISVNRAFADLIGYTADEVRALTYWQITPERYANAEKMQLDEIKRNGSYGVYRKHFIHKDGDHVEVFLHGRLTKIQGRKFVWSIVQGGAKETPPAPEDPLIKTKQQERHRQPIKPAAK